MKQVEPQLAVSRGLAAPARAAVIMVIMMFQAANDEQQSRSGTRPLGPGQTAANVVCLTKKENRSGLHMRGE